MLLRNPFYSVLALVAHLFALAAAVPAADAQFLAAAQVVVYAGAVMVLYVFVVAYVGGAEEPLAAQRGADRALGAAVRRRAVRRARDRGRRLRPRRRSTPRAPTLGAGFGSPGQIGAAAAHRFLIPFEAASFLLLSPPSARSCSRAAGAGSGARSDAPDLESQAGQ